MDNDIVHQGFREALKLSQNGVVDKFLWDNDFNTWVEIASTSLLQHELEGFKAANVSILQNEFKDTQVQVIALRVILSRNARLFESLKSLWLAFGSSIEVCDDVLRAIQAANKNWPSRISAGCDFSTGYSDFVQSIKFVGVNDSFGVIGTSIRQSRIFNEGTHVGFPMVVKGSSENQGQSRNIRDGFWVTPTRIEPQDPSQEVVDEWKILWETVNQVTGNERSEPSCNLPTLLHQLAASDVPVSTLDSAGFGLAMQLLASKANRDLPFGIGFTGRWQDKLLYGVCGLQAKMEVAKEAGVFLLFACRDPNEPIPNAVEGVKLVLLGKGLPVDEVVRNVNRVCADSGITEYRWRQTRQNVHAASSVTTSGTPDLPSALVSRCPFGFVGRDTLLKELTEEFCRERNSRELLIVVASARSGKTTLLSKFASDQALYPIWFSFRREAANRSFRSLRESVSEQISARYMAVPLPKGNHGSHAVGQISIIVDGLDEADPKDVEDVLKWLQNLPGNGLVVVGSQEIGGLDNFKKIHIQNDKPSGQEDARTLIELVAKRFAGSESLSSISNQLREDRWIEGLCKKTGSNLWILTEYFQALENERTGWPVSPDDLPLMPSVKDYCRLLMKNILSQVPCDVKAFVETFLAFLSFLDNRNWRVRDVRRLAGSFLSESHPTLWARSGILSKSPIRVIDFDGKHCRFCTPLTHEAVQINDEGCFDTEVATRFVETIRDNPANDELLIHLVEQVASLLIKVEDVELTSKLLFKTPWLHRRLMMLVQQQKPIKILCDELDALKRFVSPGLPDTVSQVIKWLECWQNAPEDSSDLCNDWWDSTTDVTQPFPKPPDFRLFLVPNVGPKVKVRQDNIQGPSNSSPTISGVRADGALVTDKGVADTPFESIGCQYEKLGVHGRVTFDGWELGWNVKDSVLLGRKKDGPASLTWNANELFGIDSNESIVIILDVRERLPQGGVWVAVKHQRQVFLVLLDLDDLQSPQIYQKIWQEEIAQDIAIDLTNACGSILVYRVKNLAGQAFDEGTFNPYVLRMWDADRNKGWSMHDNRPTAARYLVDGVHFILRRSSFSNPFDDTWRRTRADCFVYSTVTGQYVEQAGLNLSGELRILEREGSRVKIASILEMGNETSLEIIDLQVDGHNIEIRSRQKFCLPKKVSTWERFKDFLVIAYENGRIEIRNFNNPEVVNAIGYTSKNPKDLSVVPRPEGTFVVVSSDELRWYRAAILD